MKSMVYPLLSTGSTQEDLSRHDWTIVDLDIKNQTKQNMKSMEQAFIELYEVQMKWEG